MGVNPTTGLYDLAGGDTSATVTQGINNNFTDLWQQIRDIAHPIGSYYWSSDPTNPSALFGGDWEQVTDKFVLAAGSTYSVDQTGGEATHTLSVNEMPQHYHRRSNVGRYFEVAAPAGSQVIAAAKEGQGTTAAYITGNSGGGAAHNNMPPYVVAYCWKRIL